MSDSISPVAFSASTVNNAEVATGSLVQGILVELERAAAQLVGSSGVDLAQNSVKRAMVCEALARTGGNFTRAAELLGVRRQAIQNMVSRYGLRAWAANIRREPSR